MSLILLHLCCQHISKYSRSKSGGVGIDQEKQGIITENLCAKLHKWMNGILNFPDLAFRASSIGRRIHDNCVIVITSADFTLYKLHTVIYQPADWCISKTTCCRILFRPGNHSLRSIYVCNRCTCGCCRKSCTTCISEQVQHLDRSVSLTDLVSKPVPVCCLLREKTGVLEAEWFQMERKLLVMKIPLLGQIKELPFTASLGAAVIVCVHLAPSWLCLRCIPDYLRIRTDKEIFSPSLQFLAAGSINYFVFFPAICYPHFIFTSFSIISHKSPKCHP